MKDSDKIDLEQRRALLRALGKIHRQDREQEKLLEELKKSELEWTDMIGEYLVFSPTNGHADRLGTGDEKPSFTVWDAENCETETACVLKGPTAKAAFQRPEVVQLIYNEAIVISKLDHPNIVKTQGILRKGKLPYVILEHLPYQVNEVVGMKPNLEGIAFFATESAKALKHLKDNNVVHCDIKLSQFMGASNNEQRYAIKLIDFSGALHPQVATPPFIPYTTSYAAPEVISAQNMLTTKKELQATFSHKSDIYSLGLTYARLALSGKMDPEDISKIFDTPTDITKNAIKAAYDHHVSYALNRIIEDMTQKDPARRIDASQLVARLEDFCYTFKLGPKVHELKDLYTGEVRREIEHPF